VKIGYRYDDSHDYDNDNDNDNERLRQRCRAGVAATRTIEMRSKPKSLTPLPSTWLPMLLFLGGLMATGVLFAADTGPRRHAQGSYDASADRYTVAAGDALSGIALRFGTDVDGLRTLNKLSGDRIVVGQEVVIGASGRDQPQAAAPDDPLPHWQGRA
jgi:LysM repeat protein